MAIIYQKHDKQSPAFEGKSRIYMRSMGPGSPANKCYFWSGNMEKVSSHETMYPLGISSAFKKGAEHGVLVGLDIQKSKGKPWVVPNHQKRLDNIARGAASWTESPCAT